MEATNYIGKIMVLAVILLVMIAILVLLLHLYSNCFGRHLAQQETSLSPRVLHRRRQRRFVFAPGNDIFATTHYVVGLDPSALKSLPVLVFKPEEFEDGLECSVCLSEVVGGEKARLLPQCNHGFHLHCIDMWFQSHSTCPLCRTLVTATNGSTNSSDEENSGDVSGIEPSNFPTHVLVFGDEAQFSSIGVESSEEPPSSISSSSSSAIDSRIDDGMLVIDVPSELNSGLKSWK